MSVFFISTIIIRHSGRTFNMIEKENHPVSIEVENKNKEYIYENLTFTIIIRTYPSNFNVHEL